MQLQGSAVCPGLKDRNAIPCADESDFKHRVLIHFIDRQESGQNLILAHSLQKLVLRYPAVIQFKCNAVSRIGKQPGRQLIQFFAVFHGSGRYVKQRIKNDDCEED